MFVAVQEWYQTDTYNLYQSDPRGVRYSLVLGDVRSSRQAEESVVIDILEVGPSVRAVVGQVAPLSRLPPPPPASLPSPPPLLQPGDLPKFCQGANILGFAGQKGTTQVLLEQERKLALSDEIQVTVMEYRVIQVC